MKKKIDDLSSGARLPETAGRSEEVARRELLEKNPPALARPITVPDDPNKGRFGGRSEAGGYKVSASFREIMSGSLAEISLIVSAESEKPLQGPVEFFLHPTFPRTRVRVPVEGGLATLKLTAYGGFTVGVWIPEAQVELELDLAAIPNAPAVIRNA